MDNLRLLAMVYYKVDNIETSRLPHVSRGATLQEGLERMVSTDQSQIGVTDDSALVGVVSYQSIIRTLLIFGQADVSDSLLKSPVELAMEDPDPMVAGSDDLFDLFDALAESPYVLIDTDEGFHVLDDVGFHQYLRTEIEAFLLVEEIERSIRTLFQRVFEDELDRHLQETFDEIGDFRTPSSIEECSFTHYHVFLSANWDGFRTYFEEDVGFVRELLARVGEIRNASFHFRASTESSAVETEYLLFAKDYLDGRG